MQHWVSKFFSLRYHKQRYHTAESTSSGEKAEKKGLADAGDDKCLEEELQSCRHFLVYSEIQKRRQSVFNFVANNLTAQVIEEKLDRVLDKLKWAAKLNWVLGFMLKNMEDGKIRYFYAHENNTLLEQSKFVSNKGNMAKMEGILKETDVIESCTKQRSITKWRFFKLTNSTIFAALLRDILMGCKDAVLLESLLNNRTVNCLTYVQNTKKPYKDNLCFFRALALLLHVNDKRLEEETSKLFNLFLINSINPDPSKFKGVCMDDNTSVEGIVGINIFIHDIDLIDGAMAGELARRSIKMYEKNVQLIRYNSHICYVDNIHTLFKAFRCPTCDKYFQKTGNLERHLVRCSERKKHIYPKNAYQLRETFDKLDSFNIQYTDDQKLFINLAVFDFESICIPEEKFKNTEKTTWVGKHVPISVSTSSNLISEPIFLCISNPRDLVESVLDAVEGLATQSNPQMEMKFLELETAIKSKLTRTLEPLNEHRCRNQRVFDFKDQCFENDNEEKDASAQFLQMQKSQLIELRIHLYCYCNVLPVFGFNSAKYDINLIKSCLLPNLINERNMEPAVIKKASQVVSFKFGDVQLLDIMNFLGGAKSHDSFLKAYKASETKGFFPYEWFDCPQKIKYSEYSELPAYDTFFSKLRNVNPLEQDYSDYQKLLSCGLKIEEALYKRKLFKPPPSGEENYQNLLDEWDHENMFTFKDFLRW